MVNSTLEKQNQNRATIVAEEGEHRDEDIEPSLLDQLIRDFDVVGLDYYDSADEGMFQSFIKKFNIFRLRQRERG